MHAGVPITTGERISVSRVGNHSQVDEDNNDDSNQCIARLDAPRLRSSQHCFAGTIAYAQAPQPEPDDPPVRVGRMSFANGEVSYAPAGNDEWVQAQVNRPIVTGDQLWADNNSRAELSVDNSSWWLGEQTSVTVSNLDDRIAQFQLQQGTLEFRVRRLPSATSSKWIRPISRLP